MSVNPYVLIKTELGDIKLEIYEDKAPKTAANFLRYVDSKLYDDTTFFRAVTMDNQPDDDIKIEVVQGGKVDKQKEYPPIEHETTEKTGLRHLEGVISMARSTPGTATSSFFICIRDEPEFDYEGRPKRVARAPSIARYDGQGFATFGRVISGMDVVKKMHMQPQEGQRLQTPIKILSITRIRK